MKLSSTSNTMTPKGTTKATKGFISPEYFLNFFSNLYIPPLLQKSFKFPVLWLLEDTFLLMPLSKTLPQEEGNYPFPTNRVFWKFVFHPAERGEDYGAEKMTKVKLARVLVTSFDKFHHLCNFYIFGFSCWSVKVLWHISSVKK